MNIPVFQRVWIRITTSSVLNWVDFQGLIARITQDEIVTRRIVVECALEVSGQSEGKPGRLGRL